MKPATASRIAQAIQLLNLDGCDEYTTQQLADASGVNRRTISRNSDLIECFDFAINKERYHQCNPENLA